MPFGTLSKVLGVASNLDFIVEISVLWSESSHSVLTQHVAQTLTGLMQATLKSYLDGGLALHHLLDQRQGTKGRHC